MILPIYGYGEPVLRKVCEDITTEYPNLKETIANMYDTMYHAQINSEGDVYRGGSMRPLIQSLAFIRLTNERLSTLQKMNPEGKYKAD